MAAARAGAGPARCGGDPARVLGLADGPRMLSWLAEFYPELFQVADFEQRQWFYRVGFALRSLIHWPAFAPEPEL